MTLRTSRLQDTSMLPSHGLNALVLPLQRYTKEHFWSSRGRRFSKQLLLILTKQPNQAAN